MAKGDLGTEVVCDYCGKKFYKKPWVYKQCKSGKHYCNRKCSFDKRRESQTNNGPLELSEIESMEEDLRGMIFGDWTVVWAYRVGKQKGIKWKCVCRCKNIGYIAANKLLVGNRTECRKCSFEATRKRNNKKRDKLVGRTFGNMLVDSYSFVSKTNMFMFHCTCVVCGKGHSYGLGRLKKKKNRCCCSKLLSEASPEIANEWHPVKNGDATPNNTVNTSNNKFWFICPDGHEYFSRLSNRTSLGRGCPICSPKISRLEYRLFCELSYLFDNVELTNMDFGVECDIFMRDFNLCIEVDGWYWHKDKIERDLYKNHIFNSGGARVIRVRESPLSKISPVDIIHDQRSEDNILTVKEIVSNICMITDDRKVSNIIIDKFVNNDIYSVFRKTKIINKEVLCLM